MFHHFLIIYGITNFLSNDAHHSLGLFREMLEGRHTVMLEVLPKVALDCLILA